MITVEEKLAQVDYGLIKLKQEFAEMAERAAAEHNALRQQVNQLMRAGLK